MQRTLPSPIKLYAPRSAAPKDLLQWGQRFVSDLTLQLNDMLNVMNTALQGIGPDIASATVITPTNFIHRVTGTATITTINNVNGYAGPLILQSVNGFTIGTGGNINVTAPQTVSSPFFVMLVYDNIRKLWDFPF